MKCYDCTRFVFSTRYCIKYKTHITNPYSETDCKFFNSNESKFYSRSEEAERFPKASEDSLRPGCERRSKKNYELAGGLMYTQPYWYKGNKPKSKPKGKKKSKSKQYKGK